MRKMLMLHKDVLLDIEKIKGQLSDHDDKIMLFLNISSSLKRQSWKNWNIRTDHI
jgi:hypothetical protein